MVPIAVSWRQSEKENTCLETPKNHKTSDMYSGDVPGRGRTMDAASSAMAETYVARVHGHINPFTQVLSWGMSIPDQCHVLHVYTTAIARIIIAMLSSQYKWC